MIGKKQYTITTIAHGNSGKVRSQRCNHKTRPSQRESFDFLGILMEKSTDVELKPIDNSINSKLVKQTIKNQTIVKEKDKALRLTQLPADAKNC